MKPFDDADELVDGEGEFVELARSVVADRDVLHLLVDLSQGEADVRGETPGVIWGHARGAYGPRLSAPSG